MFDNLTQTPKPVIPARVDHQIKLSNQVPIGTLDAIILTVTVKCLLLQSLSSVSVASP